jgi:hypothetical protein
MFCRYDTADGIITKPGDDVSAGMHTNAAGFNHGDGEQGCLVVEDVHIDGGSWQLPAQHLMDYGFVRSIESLESGHKPLKV